VKQFWEVYPEVSDRIGCVVESDMGIGCAGVISIANVAAGRDRLALAE
jgi:hypothetical protein